MPKLVAANLSRDEFNRLKSSGTGPQSLDVFPTTAVRVTTSPINSPTKIQVFSGHPVSIERLSIDLKFDNVEVGIAGSKKIFLRGVSGHIKSGSLTALMGATGSGKTTLLSALANRLTTPVQLSARSNILYGGRIWNKALKRLVGFVEQDDIVIPALTVRQTLMFAARLRLPRFEDATTQVEYVLSRLSLEKCAESSIANMSGGERKRVCIAVELLASPRLLFLDEPTSGLDSETALILAKNLNTLATEDRVTIVCSIHQPNSQVFSNFHQLCFLYRGQCVFFGEAQHESLSYFKSAGFPCPSHYNPPDWFMEVSVNGQLESSEFFKRLLFSSTFGSPSTFSCDRKDVKALERSSKNVGAHHVVSRSTQLMVLSERLWLRLWVERGTWENFMLHLVMGLLWGLLAVGLGNDEGDIRARFGLIFLTVQPWMFFAVMGALPQLGADQALLKKELYSGTYRLSMYYIAKIVTFHPFLFIESWFMTTVIYALSLYQFASPTQYFVLVLVVWLQCSVFAAWGFLVATLLAPVNQFPFAFVLVTYFWGWSGYFRPLEAMPPGSAVVQLFNPSLYAMNLAWDTNFVYGPNSFRCTEGISSAYNSCVQNPTGSISVGQALAAGGVGYSPGLCLAILLLSTAAIHVLAFLALRYQCRKWLNTRRMMPPADLSLPPSETMSEILYLPEELSKSFTKVSLLPDGQPADHMTEMADDQGGSPVLVLKKPSAALDSDHFPNRFDVDLGLHFTNLGVNAVLKDGSSKTILQGVQGDVSSGTVLAVMGATGSGKTTLLLALSNRLEKPSHLDSSSSIRYGGRPWSVALKRLVGFVEQDDVVIPALTVRQTLMFAARLRLPGNDIGAQRSEVDKVIEKLRLGTCVDTKIGSILERGVSGGERKRVCIAVELLASPRLLFLDEPTSGLDSETALILMKSLRSLASEDGVTIVCSIHQPSSQVYSNFTQLCFLHSGRVVFFGEAQRESLTYFNSVGFPCPSHYNPPDWFMEVSVNGKLENSCKVDNLINTNAVVVSLVDVVVEAAHEEKTQLYSASLTIQLEVLSKRMMMKLLSSKVTVQNIGSFLGIGVVFMILFVALQNRDQDVYPRISLAFVFAVTCMWWPVMDALPSLVEEEAILKKELLVGAHRLSAFYVARVLTLQLVVTVICCAPCIVIFLPSFCLDTNATQFFTFLAACCLVCATFLSIGLMLAAIVPVRHLFITSLTFLMYGWSYCGLFVPVKQMYPWISWAVTINPYYSSFQLFGHIIFKYGPATYECHGDVQQLASACHNGQVSSADAMMLYGITVPPESCAWALFGYFLICHFLAYVGLWYRCRMWLK